MKDFFSKVLNCPESNNLVDASGSGFNSETTIEPWSATGGYCNR